MSSSPATTWAYASLPVDLLSVIVQDLSGQTLRDFFSTHISAPIEIPDFHWGSWNDYTKGSTDAALSARDLARLGYLSLRQGSWDNGGGLKVVVEADTLAWLTSWDARLQTAKYFESVRPFFARDSSSMNYYGHLFWTNRTGDGLGSSVPADAYYMHGFKEALCIVIPSLDMVVVRLARRGDGVVPTFRADFMAMIMAAVVSDSILPEEPVTQDVRRNERDLDVGRLDN
jgi:CubicO group peptidase (beta-lactamase class C family)